MSVLYSLLVVVLCLAGGYLTHAAIDIIPPSLYGMFYLAIGLHVGIFSADKMERTVAWVIKNMGVCFVPAGVGIMNYFGLIQSSGLAILIFTVVTTLALMVFVGIFYQKITRGNADD